MSHNLKIRFEGIATDKNGHITDRIIIEKDLILRNLLCEAKQLLFSPAVVAADGMKDVLGSATNTIAVASSLRGMQGSGVTAETSADFRIQTPLYTAPDAVSVGNVTLGAGNQVTLAFTSAHTYAGGATVTEAGLAYCGGSTVTYLTAGNIQATRDTFAGVVIGAGGTFTSTYTFTVN